MPEREIDLPGVGNARELGVAEQEIDLLREKYLEKESS